MEQVKIELAAPTHDAFAAFADEVAEHLPDAVVIFQDRPIMGDPYAIVQVKQEFGFYPLVVEAHDHLIIGPENVSVGRAWL
jgi:hypothetical protein